MILMTLKKKKKIMLANIRHVGNFAAGFSTDSDNAP